MLLGIVANMSFSQEVKKEIGNIEGSVEAYKAELYAITKLKANIIISFRAFKIEFITTSNALARRIIFLLKKVYDVEVELLTKEQVKLDRKKQFFIVVSNKAKEILLDLDMLDENLYLKEEISSKYQNYEDSLLRGFFLAKGSINDPLKLNYHLEIVCNKIPEAEYVQRVLQKYNIFANILHRPKGYVVYVKKSEHIGDFLKMIGSINALFYFENQRIKKDLNNVVNRVLNCDMANSERTRETSQKQLDVMANLKKIVDVNKLPRRLQEAIIMREKFPDYSLSELSDASYDTLGKEISKSGFSHRFKDLEEYLLALTNQKGK